ncbi:MULTISPECIES: DUF5994 family protein [Streptosporangium]|uniref:Uncharacterized protein n=1 Tax=Streptosporangium brasiliense TaxID=47480 RepID=A0ABT9R1J1_9ACTN|nr:DUF5994 family protein [Streptosporangium brasiliense]MDP9863099.1 hypothetical protein [Streptosporangium brasiliense]
MTPKLLSRITPPVVAVPMTTSSAVRLSLDLVPGHRGLVDGAWWPYSRNAGVELPGLIAAVDRLLGRPVLRVGLHADVWDGVPRRIPARGRQVEVGPSRSADHRLIRLSVAGMEHVDLLVIPSGTACVPAMDALELAVTCAGRLRPVDILTAVHAPVPAGPPCAGARAPAEVSFLLRSEIP